MSPYTRHVCGCGRLIADTGCVYGFEGRRYVYLRDHRTPDGGQCDQRTVDLPPAEVHDLVHNARAHEQGQRGTHPV